MPGGNVSTSKKPYDVLKWGNSSSPDCKAYVGGKMISSGYDDTEYGLPNFGPIPENQAEKEAWETLDLGSAPIPHRSKPGKGGSGKSY